LLAILLLTALLVSLTPVAARPVAPHPGSDWAGMAIYGIKLKWENGLYSGSAWPGIGTLENQGFPGGAAYFQPVFEVAGADYVRITWNSVPEPSSYTWPVRFRTTPASRPTAGTLSWELENADTDFVPQDFSVVLENASVTINLRTVANYFFDNLSQVNLRIDNAVNISVENLDPLSGTAGDPLDLRVTVYNTGNWWDNYVVSVGGAMDPWIALNPNTSGFVDVTTTYPLGTQAIVVTADGDYAMDKDNSLVATGVQPIVFRAYDTGYMSDTAGGIAPWENYWLGENAPIMVAKKIGGGAVVAASWGGDATKYGDAGYPSAINLDILYDITFQWMVPGANEIIWYEGDSVYSDQKGTDPDVKKLLDNLRAGAVPSGNIYTIDNQGLLRLDNLGSSTYDILVLNAEQFGTGALGGDPSLLWDNELDAISAWVAAGKGVIVLEISDYLNYCFNRVSNRILDNLGFGWWFQHDTINDNTHKDAGASYKPLVVRVVGNEIGDNYAIQDNENILAYKCPTLIPAPTISATVSVPYGENWEGTTCTVSVTITNNSTVWDNFSLSADDTLNWDPITLSTTKINLGPLASTTVDVTVTLPPGSGGLLDTLTVTATSFDSGKIFSGSNTVKSLSLLANVEVDILEDYQDAHCSIVKTLIDPCYRYDPLTYTVKVMNKGLLDDKYELEVDGPVGWGLKLTPQELFVPSMDNEYATLSVTIPDDVWGSTIGVITVTAVGKMATSEQEPLNATDNDTCIAHAGENMCVQMEILPDSIEPQTGAPSSPLVWLVVFKNVGNVVNSYELTVGEVLDGLSSNSAYRTEWGAMLDEYMFLDVPPCTKRITYLRVIVPGDALTCEWDTITVNIISLIDPVNCNDSYTVRAHVLEPGPRIPEGVIEIAVEAEVIAIYVHPTTYDFGIMDEHKIKTTGPDYFKVRNTGNVDENILVRGTDAQSMPGEPVTTWELSNVSTGVDQYMLELDGLFLEETNQLAWSDVAPGDERFFGLTIYTPTAITTPARMWARVKLVAIASGTTFVGIPQP